MVSEAVRDQISDFLDSANYTYRNVMVEGTEHTAVLYDDRWYLIPIVFKFGTPPDRGVAYFCPDDESVREVSEEYLNTLPTWS